jgi:hypothetical protein
MSSRTRASHAGGYSLYVIGQRPRANRRCTAWDNRIPAKIVGIEAKTSSNPARCRAMTDSLKTGLGPASSRAMRAETSIRIPLERRAVPRAGVKSSSQDPPQTVESTHPQGNLVPSGAPQVHQFLFFVRNRVQVVEDRQGCAGSNKPLPVEANSLRKEHLLQPLLLSERGLDPEVRRARKNARGRTRSANAWMPSSSRSSSWPEWRSIRASVSSSRSVSRWRS